MAKEKKEKINETKTNTEVDKTTINVVPSDSIPVTEG